MGLFRLIGIALWATFGALLGGIAGFFAAVVLNPDASPRFVVWGGALGIVLALWAGGCFGPLLRGALWGAVGWVSGFAAGWLLALFWQPEGINLAQWGAILGSVAMALWPPQFGPGTKAPKFRHRSEQRETARATGDFVAPAASGDFPTPPLYVSDGQILSINQLHAELKELAPGINFGMGENRRGGGIPEETDFYAADRDFLAGDFMAYVGARMRAEGIEQWTEAKFDCDDFAHYLKQCATMTLLHSPLKGATHTVLVAVVTIKEGEELLGVPDGCHANNLVRCTDGQWYFLEPQKALQVDAALAAPLLRLTRLTPGSLGNFGRRLRSGSAGGEDWMCPADEALDGAAIELKQAKF
jgi:hypothetical protein